MRSPIFRPLFILCFAISSLSVSAAPRADVPAEMLSTAQNLLATLTAEQRAKAVMPFDDPQRKDWHFIPKARKGLPLKEMTAGQQSLAHAVLNAGLSQRGYAKATTIMSLEEILAQMERSGGRMVRDSALYYFTFFGEPAANGTWGWSVEGHHMSLNFTVVQGKMIATVPTFFGSNPAEVKEGPRKGLRVLSQEEDLARTLLKSLDDKQRTSAIIDVKAPSDIITMNTPRVDPLDPKGLSAARMTQKQTELLIAVMSEYANAMPEYLAEERIEKVRKAGVKKVVFAWAGGSERGEPHYYRIQGPTFLIEFDNTQGNANHVHSVWRDFNGDFGEDLLAKHYKTAPHAHGHTRVGK